MQPTMFFDAKSSEASKINFPHTSAHQHLLKKNTNLPTIQHTLNMTSSGLIFNSLNHVFLCFV